MRCLVNVGGLKRHESDKEDRFLFKMHRVLLIRKMRSSIFRRKRVRIVVGKREYKHEKDTVDGVVIPDTMHEPARKLWIPLPKKIPVSFSRL
jgi:hypothetical protein